MQIQIFSIPTLENHEELQKMNAFLRGHKIIDIIKPIRAKALSVFLP